MSNKEIKWQCGAGVRLYSEKESTIIQKRFIEHFSKSPRGTGCEWVLADGPDLGHRRFRASFKSNTLDSRISLVCVSSFTQKIITFMLILFLGTFGLRKPWYFPFTASYWKSICGLVEKQRRSLSSSLFFFNENFDNQGM